MNDNQMINTDVLQLINHAHGLLPALLATGYHVNDRHFTRRQVQLIFEYLGEP